MCALLALLCLLGKLKKKEDYEGKHSHSQGNSEQAQHLCDSYSNYPIPFEGITLLPSIGSALRKTIKDNTYA